MFSWLKREKLVVFSRLDKSGILLEVCRGPILDRFRIYYFGPPKELELPPAQGTDYEFEEHLHCLRMDEGFCG